MLDEHGLVDRLVEAAVVDDLQCTAGIARLSIGRVEGLGADDATERDGHDDEREPPKIAVLRWAALQRPMRAARF